MNRFASQHALGSSRPRYSVFFFDLREELGLSANEYLLADVVDHLSGAKSRVPGWCYASRGYLARTVGVSRRTVQSLVTRLETKGVIERHATNCALLRSTPEWKEAIWRVRRRPRSAH